MEMITTVAQYVIYIANGQWTVSHLDPLLQLPKETSIHGSHIATITQYTEKGVFQII